MKITEFESQTAVWQKVAKELTERLEILRAKNDNNLEPLETARLRGQIAQVREILSWSNPAPAINNID